MKVIVITYDGLVKYSFPPPLDALVCHPPKSSLTMTIEQAKLKFRLESSPVVILLIILGCNIALYLMLFPCLVCWAKSVSVQN